MAAHCRSPERTKSYEDPCDDGETSCYTGKKMACCITISIVLIIAIVTPTIYYIVYNEKNVHQEAQELLHVKQAEEHNYLLQIQNLEEKVQTLSARETKLNAALRAQLEQSKSELKAQEVRYENQIEATQEKYDKQLEQLQIKLNVQSEQNRVYYAQIVQLHGEHLKEITTMLDEFKETRNSFNDVDNYLKKSKDRLQTRWDALNKEKERVAATLRKLNASKPSLEKIQK